MSFNCASLYLSRLGCPQHSGTLCFPESSQCVDGIRSYIYHTILLQYQTNHDHKKGMHMDEIGLQ